MIAMLRATARASVGDRWHSFSGLALVGTIPVLGFLPLSGVGPAALLFCAIQLLFVGFLGMHLRGRAIGPGGMPTLAGPMPMLPVSRTKRVTAVVVVGEVLLLGVSVGIWALRWVIVSGTGVADSQWERSVLGPQPFAFTLATWALAWAPLLAAGSEGGVEMGGGRALLYGVGFMGLAAAGVDQSLPLAAVWCVAGLLILPRIPASARSEATGGPRLGRGLVGVLATQGIVTLPVALGMGGLGLGMAAMGLAGWQALVSWCMVVTAAMLPVLPPTFESGTVQPTSVGALAVLPVSRNRLVLSIFAASAVRVAIAGSVGWLVVRLSGATVDAGPQDHPIGLLCSALCLTAALQLAGLRHRPMLAVVGTLLGMVALSGGFDGRTEFPEWYSLGMPALAGFYAIGVGVRTSRRGVWA